MAKPFVPWSKEKNDRWIAEGERQREETDRCILAALDAIERGEDPKAAVEAASDAPRKPKVADA